MDHSTVIAFLASIAVLLATARAAGTLFQRLGAPPVVGEILAGLLVGKTGLGRVWPAAYGWLFPPSGPAADALSAVTLVGVVLLLFVAGLEMDLRTVVRQGRAAVLTSVLSMVVPFAMGMLLIYAVPDATDGSGHRKLTMALFFGVALSISALPVIAKTLLDLKLFKTDLGLLIMAAGMVNDFVGWAVFAVVLSMIAGKPANLGAIGLQVAMTVGFIAVCLFVLRPLIDQILVRLRRRDPHDEEGGILSTAVVLTFVAATLTEKMGAHAVFGAFLVGVSVGASKHLRESTRTVAHRMVAHILAPLFFGSMALGVDFIAAFDVRTVLVFCVVAFAGKIGGATLGARLGGLSPRESWAVGFGMNARGAMEIILATVAMRAGLIGPPIFVALVVMAVLTSVVAGPAMTRLLERPQAKHPLAPLLHERLFVPALLGTERDAVVGELSRLAAAAAHLPPEATRQAVLERERLAPTAMGEGVAVPHARLEELHESILVVGRSRQGVDFDAPDGLPAHLIFLILTPADDLTAQLQIVGAVARAMADPEARQRALEAGSFTELKEAMGVTA